MISINMMKIKILMSSCPYFQSPSRSFSASNNRIRTSFINRPLNELTLPDSPEVSTTDVESWRWGEQERVVGSRWQDYSHERTLARIRS